MRRTLLLAVALLAFAFAFAPAASPATVSLAPDGTRTVTGGGHFVEIPGFPGRFTDRRLLPDIAWMASRFHIEITSGYSLSRAHTPKGEHPRGLAIDIVPGRGGSWADVTRLALWAEPGQDRPRAPFKWVGYRGDAGHGDPGHCRRASRGGTCFPHLHLSWQHAQTPIARPAPWVEVLRFKRLG